MKHCYTDCIIKSDDEYRTRYDCRICKKSFYQLKDRTSKVDSNESLIAGKILLKDGTPHIECGNCQQYERLHDSKNIRIFIPFSKPEKNIYKGWEKLTPTYEYVNGVRVVRERSRMIILSSKGCQTCYNLQDSESQRLGRPHVFNANNTKRVEPKVTGVNTTVLKPIEQVEVIPTKWETAGRTKVQRWGQTRESVLEDDKARTMLEKRADELSNKHPYGPYNDRKGK